MTLRPPVPSRFARNYITKMSMAQMTSTITIFRPSPADFDTDTGQISAGTGTTIWSGPARIYSESGSLASIGGELVSLGQTYMAIPQTALGVHVDDLAQVTATLDDPALVNTVFRIVDVSAGGLLSATRRLTVTTVEPNPWNTE